LKKENRTKEQLNKAWKLFQPQMECALFHTTALIDDYYQIRTLIDDGAACYAAINERLAQRLKLPMVDMDTRRIEGVIGGATTHLDKVTTFTLDIGGLKTTKAWAYVVPNQSEDLILGHPWLKSQLAKINTTKSQITFEQYDFSLSSDEEQLANPNSASRYFRVTPVPASVYAALATRQRKTKNPRTQIFAVTLADIEKALKPKPTLSMEQVLVLIPKHYKSEAEAWNPTTASQLPPHRPGINHKIHLEKDANGKPRDVL
jgi:predicted aspartyl protease